MQDHAADAAMAAIGKNMAVGGGGSALIFGMTIGDIAGLGGLVVAAIGLCIQWYYNRKKDRRDASYKAKADAREAELHAARLQELREE